MIDVHTKLGYCVSKDESMHGRASQCVLLGGVDMIEHLGSLAHIHYLGNHKRILDNMFNEMLIAGLNEDKLRLKIGGGVDAFVPGMGFVPGKANADRILDYLILNNLENKVIFTDLYTDFVREMNVNPQTYKIKLIRTS